MMDSQSIVYVVDDDEATRQSLQWMIEGAGLRCQTYEDAQSFVASYRPSVPGCLVLDLYLKGATAFNVLDLMAANHITMPTIVMTGTAEVSTAVQCMKLGLLDYLEKPVDPALLLDKIRQGIENDIKARAVALDKREIQRRLSGLTEREKQLIPLICQGMSNKQMAQALNIAVKTVENHRAHLMNKTRAGNSADIVRLAMLSGEVRLTSEPEPEPGKL